MKSRLAVAVVMLAGMVTANAQNANGGVVNVIDPGNAGNVLAPPPVLGAGWAYDQINQVGPTVDSPWVYNFPFQTLLSLTDDFVSGDTWTVWEAGNPLMTTAFIGVGPALPPPPGAGDAAWNNPVYSKGQLLLSPGSHALVVTGDGTGGVPAGMWARIDAVPEPEEYAIVACLALAAFGAYRRLRK